MHLAQTQSAKKDSQECPIVEKERSYGTLKKAISARQGADGTLSKTIEHRPHSLCRTYRHLHQGAFSTCPWKHACDAGYSPASGKGSEHHTRTVAEHAEEC